MINSKNLIKIAKKWQRLAAQRRKQISLQKIMVRDKKEDLCSSSSRAEKGNFVVYSTDGRRFLIPLVFLGNDIFKELLVQAEEEFGRPRDGPIMVPCDGIFMEYALSLIERQVAADLQKALLTTMTNGHYATCSEFLQGQRNYQSPICSF
ncbi:hypothetical protein Nepgr_019965 [Nepenthes gracilis]|uniref:Small auxin up regulated protein n=1 Tax=Nepenthes gracilis TaxID=150966 RepID=A0AAD3SWS8_NEPGR|nr:hypothetical protein Nepgr_019965 [Nepenthes gracilis]